jgi:pimeloyl-ACP methyl ester carboxylesterase
MALSEQTTTVNGKLVHYWQHGDPNQRPLLLLHGGFGNAYSQWGEVMPLLAEDYFVVSPDFPGYGQSEPLRDMSFNSLLNWLRGFLAALEIEAAVIVGHSFGALFGRLLAASSPALVPALVMVNGGVIPDVPPLARFLGSVPVAGKLLFDRISTSTVSKSSMEGVIEVKSILTPQFMNSVEANRRALSRLMRSMSTSSIPKTQNPAIPIMLLWGEADTVTPLRVAEYIKKSLPGAQLSPISGTGHLPQIEAPEVFASQVLLFLKQLDRGRRGGGASVLKL